MNTTLLKSLFTSYHNSLRRLTISRLNELPQLFSTSYHNSSQRVIATRQGSYLTQHIALTINRLKSPSQIAFASPPPPPNSTMPAHGILLSKRKLSAPLLPERANGNPLTLLFVDRIADISNKQ